MLARRRGLSLIEVLASLFIIGILAAAIYPTIAAQWRRGQGAALGGQLANIRDAVVAYRGNVARYPRTVLQLVNPLGVLATDACGATMTAPIRNSWRGPYLSQAISSEIPIGTATVKDTFIRVPATDAATAPGLLQVRVINVDSIAAADVERQFDGEPINYGAGSVLWTTAGADTLTFQILIRNC